MYIIYYLYIYMGVYIIIIIYYNNILYIYMGVSVCGLMCCQGEV